MITTTAAQSDPSFAVSFSVYGAPKPAGSKRVFGIKKGGAYTGRFIVTDASGRKGKGWRGDCKASAIEAMRQRGLQPTTKPLQLAMTLFMPRPKSHFRSGRHSSMLKGGAPKWHVQKPDATKLLRSVEDALTGIVWRDDCQVCVSHVRKVWAPAGGTPGAVVMVTEVEE